VRNSGHPNTINSEFISSLHEEINVKNLYLLLMIIATLGLTACEEGPAEETGERIDEITTDTRNAIEDACEDVKDGVDAEDKNC
jgi:hypothetical protein